eukprot:g3267.t1
MELEFVLLIAIFSIAFGLVFVRACFGPCASWIAEQRRLEAEKRADEQDRRDGITPEDDARRRKELRKLQRREENFERALVGEFEGFGGRHYEKHQLPLDGVQMNTRTNKPVPMPPLPGAVAKAKRKAETPGAQLFRQSDYRFALQKKHNAAVTKSHFCQDFDDRERREREERRRAAREEIARRTGKQLQPMSPSPGKKQQHGHHHHHHHHNRHKKKGARVGPEAVAIVEV